MNGIRRRLPSLAVLLVEDNEINRKVAHAFLSRGGHRVTTCDSGREALRLIAEQQFDVILMDIHMPEMDGMETTRRIRALEDPQKARTPIVALTANYSPEEVAAYTAAGVAGIVRKPLRMEAIEAALAPLLAGRAANLPPEDAKISADAPIFDADRLRMLTEAIDRVKLLELFEIARRSILDAADELRRNWRAGNRQDIASTAHRLAGVASNFGCVALAGIAAEIENDCRQGGDGLGRLPLFDEMLTASLAALPRAE